jgi:hypothetical protein
MVYAILFWIFSFQQAQETWEIIMPKGRGYGKKPKKKPKKRGKK